MLRKVLVMMICLGLVGTLANAADESKIPKCLKGFSGTLEGTVIDDAEHGFILKVSRIVNTWKGNKAKEPECAVDKELLINVQWVKGKDGKWRPNPHHAKFVKSLKIDEPIKIEVINDEPGRLHILELSEEQRQRGEEVEDKDESKEGRIETGKPKYLARGGKEWRKYGRVVGHLRDAPNFKIKVLNKSGRVIKTVTIPEKEGAYEIEWLRPGTYTLHISAKGYPTLEKEVEVKAKHDLFMVLEFEPPRDIEAKHKPTEDSIKSEDPPSERSTEDNFITDGIVVGTVVAKGKQWLEVKSVSGKKERYLEHREKGEKVSRGLEQVKVGDRVALKWAVNDHPRFIAVEKLDE